MKIILSLRSLFIAGLMVSGGTALAAEEATATIDCTNAPGASLCQNIRVMKSYFVSCNGDGCSSLMRDQDYSMARVTDSYYRVVPPGAVVAQDLGLQAKAAAATICGYSWKDVTDTQGLTHWVINANRALDSLKELQLASNTPNPKHCQMSVHDFM